VSPEQPLSTFTKTFGWGGVLLKRSPGHLRKRKKKTGETYQNSAF